MADAFANQPIARLTAALEQAIVKGALKGDRALLEDLRREIHAIQSGVMDPVPVPAPFRGKKQAVFEAMLAGCNNTEAAQKGRCSRQQVQRYVRDPEFIAELVDARAGRVQAAQSAMEDLVPVAIKRLRGVLNDARASHRDVITAAKEVLDRGGMPTREVHEIATTVPSPVATIPDDELSHRRAALESRLRCLEGGKE